MAWNHPAAASAPAIIRLTSSAFTDGGPIPLRYAGAGVGENVSPSLAWTGLPPRTVELALVMEDPDAPLPRPFVHLVVTGIPPMLEGIAEGVLSEGAHQFVMGRNMLRQTTYAGPRALPGHGLHHYVFELFALNRKLSFQKPPSLTDLTSAMARAVVARGRFEGTFQRT
ncbi:YbhB/YbcL family Raf kinase inhibitor-like protein [Bradyrhizobium sp. SYSU BS000235]|uniref:YbhB/YbcL family Raf kinase inhibitor-like protein n=1 Tax=Bradyrhizobium sp. SYSU BS000235 TaxID=3411332 RepID=UPI003C786BD7